jgi:hypothetical protein
MAEAEADDLAGACSCSGSKAWAEGEGMGETPAGLPIDDGTKNSSKFM